MGRVAKQLYGLANLGICFMLRTSLEATGDPTVDFPSYVCVCVIQFNRDLLSIYDMPEIFWCRNNEKKKDPASQNHRGETSRHTFGGIQGGKKNE